MMQCQQLVLTSSHALVLIFTLLCSTSQALFFKHEDTRNYPEKTASGNAHKSEMARVLGQSHAVDSWEMVEARKLLDSLRSLDASMESHIDLVYRVLKERERSKQQITDLEGIDDRLDEDIDDQIDGQMMDRIDDQMEPKLDVDSIVKRQKTSGAHICIWKVCPPSPWRRKVKLGPGY